MIDLNTVGAHLQQTAPSTWQVNFGIYLPGITPSKGYGLKVCVIHEDDQFVRSIPPQEFNLTWVGGSEYDLWQTSAALTTVTGTSFGTTGKYLYRYQLLQGGDPVVFWFADPFGREAGMGTLSAFTFDPAAPSFTWTDVAYRTPYVDDLVIYELHVSEFNGSFAGIEKQLDYLKGLGVNALEIMPFTNMKESVEWGYTPLGYFAPEERYGGLPGLKDLVNTCHEYGIAIIMDAVYAHAHPEFAYNIVYHSTPEPNPMMGVFAGEFFQDAPGTDYTKNFTREYFQLLNQYLLQEFHLDGFRYDYVPGFFDSATGVGYASLVYNTYEFSKTIPRFHDPAGFSRIIQCAENLPDPKGILSRTYSNTCWQNSLMDKAADTSIWNYIDPNFAFLLDPVFSGYPATYQNPATGEQFPVAPFQYIESHDNPSFLARIAPSSVKDLLGQPYGSRSKFYRVQPYVIALFAGKGIPMLWEGQEIGENWGMTPWGVGRNLFERPVRWEYFYDRYGKSLVRLHRIMGTLRRKYRALTNRGRLYYFNDPNHYSEGVIVLRRDNDAAGAQPAEDLMVFINFSNTDQTVWVAFPTSGRWVEQIDKAEATPRPDINVGGDGEWHSIVVPSYYGCVYAKT
jgi:1,4-alpha-glucan branching enzyme